MRIDGFLYVAIAFFGYLQGWLGTDDAEKYLSAAVLFYAKGANGAIGAAVLALKMFRSEAFAKHKANGHKPLPQQPEPEKP